MEDKSDKGHNHNDIYVSKSHARVYDTLAIGNTYIISACYSYSSGVLLKLGPVKSSIMYSIRVTGNSYSSSTLPFNSVYQFYDYGNGSLMNYSGVNFGHTLGAMTVYRHEDGYVYAHISETTDWQTFGLAFYTNSGSLTNTIRAYNQAKHTTGIVQSITITPTNK